MTAETVEANTVSSAACPKDVAAAIARRMAAGVHDINNWLNVVTTFSEVLQLTLLPGTPEHDAAVKVAHAGRKAATECVRLAEDMHCLVGNGGTSDEERVHHFAGRPEVSACSSQRRVVIVLRVQDRWVLAEELT